VKTPEMGLVDSTKVSIRRTFCKCNVGFSVELKFFVSSFEASYRELSLIKAPPAPRSSRSMNNDHKTYSILVQVRRL
jgi:hypothetical protein